MNMDVRTLKPGMDLSNTVAAIGFFDGVHLGHAALLQKTRELAASKGSTSAVVTFDEHPRRLFSNEDFLYLTPLAMRLEHFEAEGFDVAYVLPFDRKMASLSPETFIEDYLGTLQTLVCGFDFTYGRGGLGDVYSLRETATFEVVVLDERTVAGDKIGSTRIRRLLREGKVRAAETLLGRPYTIEGTVVAGDRRGRTIAYPTANLETGAFFIPARGVYATRTKVQGRWHPSMSSIGYNPTLNRSGTIRVETHLLDYQGDLYGETLRLAFIEQLREERHFPTTASLVAQIKEDEQRTRDIFKSRERLP